MSNGNAPTLQRVCSCEENCRRTYTDWTAVSPETTETGVADLFYTVLFNGVYAVANHLYRTGHKPVTKLYSGYRHEIHNYKAIKNEVVAGITDFFDSQLG